MSEIERKLISALMSAPEEITKVYDMGLRDVVFEDPLCRSVYALTIDYWLESQMEKAPTCYIVSTERPGFKFVDNVEEATTWLAEKLQKRYVTNQTQEMLREAATTSVEDPIGTLRTLQASCTETLDGSGALFMQSRRLYTDIGAMLDDELPEAPRPEILRRTDGVPLFYRGEVNLLFGDPEHGKTWVGLAACAESLASDGRVLVVDIDHNGPGPTVHRLLTLGAPKEALRDPERFRHCVPGDAGEAAQIGDDCAVWRPDVVLIDSTGELMPMFGASSDNSDDFTRVHNKVLQPLADTGAAVILVDHLAKGRESRDFGPGGSMAKRRTVGGSSLRVVRKQPFTRAGGGSAHLLVNKDRHGGVRDHCDTPKQGQGNIEQLAGTFILDANADGSTWKVVPPEVRSELDKSKQEFRPTELMERASMFIEQHPGEFTRNKIGEEVTGKKETVLLAVDILDREKYVSKKYGARGYIYYTSVSPYRQSEDSRVQQDTPLRKILLQERQRVSQADPASPEDE